MRVAYLTVEEYFATLDESTLKILKEVRMILKENLPEAKEKISWGMPTFYKNVNLVHYFANKKHIGFYPGDTAIDAFKEELFLMGLKYSKRAVQFPISKPMPLELIERITKFRLKEVEKDN